MIVSKCPLRVSLVGGSTDLQGFIDQYGIGSVISFPPNLYTYITINENISTETWKINYSKSEEVYHPIDIKNDIAREVIKHFDLPPVIMSFNCDIPTSGSGLASSSSYLTACIAAAYKFKGINYSQTEIAKLAIELERRFNPLTGYQDTYGCALGGLKQLIFYPDYVLQESLTSKVLSKYKTYLVPTGLTRSSTSILETIDHTKSFPLLDLVDKFHDNINHEKSFFNLLNHGWETKKSASDFIVDDELIKQELFLKNKYDIKGFKLCGAGGGGYFLIITKDRVKEGTLIDIDNKGVQTWNL